MTQMRLSVHRACESVWEMSLSGTERGYAWDLVPIRRTVAFPCINGREKFKTVAAARKDAHAWAAGHNIAIAKREVIEE